MGLTCYNKHRALSLAPVAQLDRVPGYEPVGRGFESLLARHVGTSYACSDFFMQKNQSPASLFLLFRKKARSTHLFVCKRTHDGSLSLPPFCDGVPTGTESFAFGRQAVKLRSRCVPPGAPIGTSNTCSVFFVQKTLKKEPKNSITKH